MATDPVNREHAQGKENPSTQFRDIEDVLDDGQQFK